jgi:hypothetical protein
MRRFWVENIHNQAESMTEGVVNKGIVVGGEAVSHHYRSRLAATTLWGYKTCGNGALTIGSKIAIYYIYTYICILDIFTS